MRKLNPKKFLFVFLFVVGALMLTTILINVYVNPYSYYGDNSMGSIRVFNAQKAKLLYLKKHKNNFNAFVLGSSNSMRMKPSTIDSLFNVKSFNYGVYQASVEDFYCITNGLLTDLEIKPKMELFF